MARDGFILLYHAVFPRIPEGMATGLHNVTPEVLAQQLAWVRQGYDVVDVETWLEREDRRGKVAVTFDDGYRSALARTLPILADLDITATFFLNGAMLEGEVLWRDKLRHLVHAGLAERFHAWLPAGLPGRAMLAPGSLFEASKDPAVIASARMMALLDDFAAAAELAWPASHCATAAELPLSRHIRYGSHGWDHGVLASLPEAALRHDLRRNRRRLLDLGLPADRLSPVLALPFGTRRSYTARTLEIVAEEGYRQVLLTDPPAAGLALDRTGGLTLAPRLTAPPTRRRLQEVLEAAAAPAAARRAEPALTLAAMLPEAPTARDRARLGATLAELSRRRPGAIRLVLGLDPAARGADAPLTWTEIADGDALRRHAAGARDVIVTTPDEAGAIVERLGGLRDGIDPARPYLAFLVERAAPPLLAARNDGPVASFCCSAGFLAETLAPALASPSSLGPSSLGPSSLDPSSLDPSSLGLASLGPYAAARCLAGLGPALPQLFIRQFPEPEASPERAGAAPLIAVSLAGSGASAPLLSSLAALRRQRGAAFTIDVGIDAAAAAACRPLLPVFPGIGFHSLGPAGSGTAAALQFLLRHRRSPLVAHAETGDLATSDRLSRLAGRMTQQGADIIGSHELRIDESRRELQAWRYPLDAGAALAHGLQDGGLQDGGLQDGGPPEALRFGLTLARRRALVESGGFSTALPEAAETQLLWRALLLGRHLANVDAFLALRPAPATASPSRRRIEDALRQAVAAVAGQRIALRRSTLAVTAAPRPIEIEDLRSGARLRMEFPEPDRP